MSIRIRFLATVLAIYCSLLAPLVEATSLPESVQIHGFASQGYIQTTENDFFGDSSDGGSFDFRELGINGSWYITPNLLTAVQLVSRNAGETDDGALRVDYALVNYNLV